MVKLSLAKYWFCFGYLDAWSGMSPAAPITIPANCREFYERGHKVGSSFAKKDNLTEAAKRVLCS
jgi:hypothetical protein